MGTNADAGQGVCGLEALNVSRDGSSSQRAGCSAVPPEQLPGSRADAAGLPGCSRYLIHRRFRDLCTSGDLEEFGITKGRIKAQTSVMNVKSTQTTRCFMLQINSPVKQIQTTAKLAFVAFLPS